MMRGGRGGNRPNFRQSHDNRGGHGGFKKEFTSPKDRKSEWVSYKRPAPSSDKTPVKSEKPDEKPVPKTPPKPQTNDPEETPKVADNGARSRSPLVRPAGADKNTEMNTPKLDRRDDSPAAAASSQGSICRSFGKQGEKKFSGRCRLFVANMNNTTTEAELRELFSQYGEAGEVYVNKEKGFGFIRLDYRHNAEVAKSSLDKKMFKGRVIQVRFATHASAIELHGLDEFASNEYIEQAMSQFGTVERAVVVCDDRGRSKGYAIVEFEWKKSAQKVMDRFKEEMFVLGRLSKPVFAKPRCQLDEEEGVHESDLERQQGLQVEREFVPRFISPSSFEYTWAKKWRDLSIEEEDKKAKLDQEIQQARYRLQFEMEAAIRDQEAVKIRDELLARQDELRRLEEDMRRRKEMDDRTRQELDRKRSHVGRGHNPPSFRDSGPPQDNRFGPRNEQPSILQQSSDLVRAAGFQQSVLGIRPDAIRPGLSVAGLALPPGALLPGLQPGLLPGPRGAGPPPPQGLSMQGGFMRPPILQGGPPPRREFPPRGIERFDHKRPRRN